MAKLALTAAEVGALTRPQREDRLMQLIADALLIVDRAVEEHVTGPGKTLTATAIMFSGGNDSITVAHLFRRRATHAIHANTGIGVEATRQFVRDTCAYWGLSLIEKHPPAGSTYRELIEDRGFPGPSHHWKMYQRLKGRCFRAARNDLVRKPRRERVLFLAGRRREESQRRSEVPEYERDGSIVWVSPLVHWTKLDLNTYRLMARDVPVNEVTDLLHMSGECLCGAFAHPGERSEIETWAPDAYAEILRHEEAARAAGHAGPLSQWGWAADLSKADRLKALRTAKRGRLCSNCNARHAAQLEEVA